MYSRNNRDPMIAPEATVYQFFNYVLRYTILNGMNSYGEILDRDNFKYALGIYAIIADKEILIKEYQLNYDDLYAIRENPKFPKVDYSDTTKTQAEINQGRANQDYFICTETRKTLSEKYVPIAKKYIEIKAEEHLRTEMRIAKEFGIEYKPFFTQKEQTGI